MKVTMLIITALLLLPALALPALGAAPKAAPTALMGVSDGHDLDALWAEAQKAFDPAQRDAVLLLESLRVDVQTTGAVATTVHRVVWIGTATGLRAYANLRVPWNSATCTLDVTKLRTWRGGRWWPDAQKLSLTAIVETLPYAVDHADDYTSLRETMLLHDGVELPCIMETEYTLTERGLPGADDLFVLPQRDPAALVQLVVSAPATRPLNHRELNGAPVPGSGEQDNVRTLTWTLRPAPALRLPLTAEPAAYEPTVAWSTWRDDAALGQAWYGAFMEAAVAPTAARDSLRAALRDCAGDQARLEAGGKWLETSVRAIHVDDRWWAFTPRPATRTWETAYGHTLDRAALWAGLLKGEGWEVTALLADTPGAPAAPDLPHLAGRGKLLLQAFHPEDDALGHGLWYCDPADGTVHTGDYLTGRPLLWLDTAAKPEKRLSFEAWLTLELSLAAGDSAWTGTGFAAGRGLLTFGHPAADALVAGLLSGAKVSDVTATALDPTRSELRFDLSVPFAKADQDGRRTLVVGRPKGGLLDRLPGDCRLDDQNRATPVLLDCGWRQTVIVHLKPAAGARVARPADRTLTNAAGTFRLEVTEQDGWLTLRRDLALLPAAGQAGNWTALRALLLEEADPANGTVAWRPGE